MGLTTFGAADYTWNYLLLRNSSLPPILSLTGLGVKSKRKEAGNGILKSAGLEAFLPKTLSPLLPFQNMLSRQNTKIWDANVRP